eukprot:412473_1
MSVRVSPDRLPMTRQEYCDYVVSISYDLLTILISIADITTDIIVLIDFWMKGRTTFFAISLVILILAQCSYSIAFAMRFDTIYTWGSAKAFAAFCCMLPFGTFVAFFIYFANDESGFECFNEFIYNTLGLDGEGIFYVRNDDSKMVKWIKRKLERHLGFLLESVIEAFPQSLLQIVAIVYYEEATYVSIISILLSMFSVMTKSLMLSQGIDIFTFIWTWLCVVTDFFGIFFTLTWVFYSHDAIHGNFMGYFNIFGQIWLWKFAISTLIPIAFGIIVFFGLVYWVIACGLFFDPEFSRLALERCGYSCLWIIFSPILAVLCVFGGCLGGEVFCFSILAVTLYAVYADRIGDYDQQSVVDIVKKILEFIAKKPTKNRIISIAAVNKAINKCQSNKCVTICKFIDKTMENGGYDELLKISYKDIRSNCRSPAQANLIKNSFDELMQEFEYLKSTIGDANSFGVFYNYMQMMVFICVVFIFGPILLLSKLIQIVYPYVIIGYLLYYDLLFSNQVDTFQIVMLCCY